jgi:release factor glutamine methyltransferase
LGAKPPVNSVDLIASVSDLPRHEAERLLCKATGRPRTDLLLGIDVDNDARATFETLVERRRTGEPLQYIEERIPFGPVEVSVDPRVLIPRPETEQLFEIACGAVADPKVIVDLCTGSGNLALALKHTFPDAAVYATDRSPDAIVVAQANARDADLDINVLEGDLFDPVPDHLRGRVDLIVANPPYVSEAEFAELPAEVRDHEPKMALVAGASGTEVLTAIADEAPEWLAPGGTIVCEISEFHGPETAARFAPLNGRIQVDIGGRDRFVVGNTSSGS